MIAGFEPWQLAAAFSAALAAGFVRGLAGFGLSVVLVPVLGLAIAPAAAVLVGNISLFLIGLTDVRRIRAHADRSALPIALLAIAAMPLGLWAVTAMSPQLAGFLIALISLGAFALVVLPPGSRALAQPIAVGLTGISTGFLGGFAGMPGPGMAPFYLRGRLQPLFARASMMAIFLALTPLTVALFYFTGNGTWHEALLAAALFPAVLAGDWLGHRAFGRVSARQWQLSTFAVLAATAFAALLRLV